MSCNTLIPSLQFVFINDRLLHCKYTSFLFIANFYDDIFCFS